MHEGFLHIKELLERYMSTPPPGERVISFFVRCAGEVGVTLSKDDCVFDRGIVRVNTTGARKHMLFMHKTHILSRIAKEVGENTVQDIR